MPDALRIAIVDDHPVVREGVIHILSGTDDVQVVAQGATASEAVRIVHQHSPDILLLDLGIPGIGLDALRQIMKEAPRTKVVILTMSDNNADVLEALRCGASGYILKGVSGTELRAALHRVQGSGSFVSPDLATRLLVDLSRNVEVVNAKRYTGLTDREKDVFRLVRRGYCNKEIGSELDLSEKTVKHYLTNIFKKLDVRNRTELAMLN